MTDIAALVTRIKALQTHPISGYEWECDGGCHYHFAWHGKPTCDICGNAITEGEDGSVDRDGRPCEHDDLVCLARVLEVLNNG